MNLDNFRHEAGSHIEKNSADPLASKESHATEDYAL